MKYGSNSDCELISADNEYSTFYLTNIILSKGQSGIKIDDYYSYSQRNELERNNQKRKLIEKALNN